MLCTQPRIIMVTRPGSTFPQEMEVPCGQCIACRIAKRKEWSLRLLHESSYWDDKSFVTLTYDDDHMPEHGTISKMELQKFVKRLRKNLNGRRIKYFACGEYGDSSQRPHYHIILLGVGLKHEDKQVVKDCWRYCDWTNRSISRNSFGLVEPDSIRYVAQYVDKKYVGDLASEIYHKTNREVPFKICSQGIGLRYALENKSQIDNLGYITHKGVKNSIPRYYIKKLELDTERLREQALFTDCEKNEHYTGINVSTDDALRSLQPELIQSIYEGQLRSRKQSEKNLTAKVMLKQSKI